MTTPRVTVPVEIVAACEGEQEHFETWAKLYRYDMSEHPLHYIFTDPKTDAARMGWNAALAYVRDAAEPLSAAPAPEGGAVDDGAWAVAVGRLTWAANTHPDPEKKALLTQWAEECRAALASREEAPAEAGDAFLSWLEREIDEASLDIGASHQEGGTATEREKARPGILSDVRAEYLALRVQPPHLSGRLPKEVTIFCPKCALRNGHEWRPRPFATVGVARPAPDALREDSQAWGMLADLVSWFTKPVQGQNGMVWVIPAGDQGADDAVAAALAALQAEQGAK